MHCAFTLSLAFFHFFFFFNDTATTEIYTLSLHDALPISLGGPSGWYGRAWRAGPLRPPGAESLAPRALVRQLDALRSEEHTSELQSQSNLVCRLLLEKKKKKQQVTSGSRGCLYNAD